MSYEYYNNYDEIPLFNWRKAMEKQLFKFVRLDISKGIDAQDVDAWMKVYDSYLEERGIGNDMIYLLDLKNAKMELELEFAENGDNFLRNEIRRLNKEIIDYISKDKGLSIDEILVHLSKFCGYRINQKEMTAKEFYILLDVYSSQSKEN